MSSEYRLIIVGAGIVGCSVAHHLSQFGWNDILVVDKGPLFDNHGSTSHAPGGMHVVNPSRMMTDFAVYSTKLYGSLDPYEEGRPCFRPVGGIEVAHSQERWQDLKRKLGVAKAYGVEAHLLTPSELKERVPLVDPSVAKGAFYVPGDANVLGVHVTGALAKSATGAEFRGHTPVESLLQDKGKVVGVRTAGGEVIKAERVLLCNNIWAPVLAAQVGVRLPLLAAQHQYAVTEALAELADYADQEIVYPIMRHQDYSLYYRQHWDCWGIGNYRHEPLLVDPLKVGTTALRDFTPEHFEVARSATAELFPATEKVGIKRSFNGMFAFTIDGFPIMGPTPCPGLWTGTGVWITHAGGVGKALAEWLDQGYCSWDIGSADVSRFHRHQSTRRYVWLRCAQNYREVYDVIHPVQPMQNPRGLRRAPFHHRLEELGAHCFEAGGWEVAQWYACNGELLDEFGDQIPERDDWASRFWSPIQGAEHLAVRKRGGLFNLSALAVLEVRGAGARDYLERLAANRIAPAGRVTYSAFLDENGGIRADLTLFEKEADVFWVFTGGGIAPRDLAWLKLHLPGDGSVEVVDRSAQTCALGLWGPKARDVLQSLCRADLSNESFRYYRHQEIEVGSVPVQALRISYAGELGWELHAGTEFGTALWDSLWPAALDAGMVAAGSGAFDSLRLEKGYRLWGADLDTEHDPFQAGLGWAVKMDKGDFLGRSALLARAENRGDARRLCCLTVEGTILGKEPILHRDRPVGYVTSANYGYSVGKMLAYGYLPPELCQVGQELEIEYFNKKLRASVAEDPQFDPMGERIKL